MEELYNWEQVKAYAKIGLYNLLHSANKSNIEDLEQLEMFLDELPKVHKKENVVEYANKLKNV